jgi:histone deacetylase 11
MRYAQEMFRVAYHPRYNLGFPGAERLHPFDLRKYARAWHVLKKSLGRRLQEIHLRVAAPTSDEQLALIHTPEYLKSLRTSAVVAQAIEVPSLRRAPWWLLDRFVLQPMRWAAAGTIEAANAALRDGLAFNLGGGFHHAKPNGGEGFSIYNDIAVMVRVLRQSGQLAEDSRVAYIDLDAHQCNGVACCFRDDPRVFLFDIHNGAIYPMLDVEARERVDCLLPVRPGCRGNEYLNLLRKSLPPFLGSVGRSATIGLAIYNAGTDVLDGDPLGGLPLSMEDVLARDCFVLKTLRERKLPTVVLTSGGYTSVSYQAIAQMILAAAEH